MRPIARLALALVLAVGSLVPAAAVQPDEILRDPALERRARDLSAGLRCLVCQNQSIDDSDAPLARDLRVLVRERLVAGDSNEEVRAFVVQRYGEFVLLKPPFGLHTAWLWLTPVAVFGLGAVGLVLAQRRRRAPAASLTPEERERLSALLRENGRA